MSPAWGSTIQEHGTFGEEKCSEEKDWVWDPGCKDKWRKEGKKEMCSFLSDPEHQS